ncbi:hypothetical protein [Brachybacterium tyrofermentans]|uniref:hypothetical protein n=1 Tax=Brachybacterium tyrofermentans TaxID=47848 RepID=UPI003FD68547
MAPQRGDPPGYDWGLGALPSEADPSVPAGPVDHPGPVDHRATAERPGAVDHRATVERPGAAERSGTAERSGADERPLPDAVGPYGIPDLRGSSGPTGAGRPDPRGERPSRGIPPWAIVAIVALQVVAMVGSVGLIVGGALRLFGQDQEPAAAPATRSGPSEQAVPDKSPGVVTDTQGEELEDGTGGFDDPAVIGEHTLSWTTWTAGTISVSALDADLDAGLPGAQGADVVEDGYRLIEVTYEVRYEGSGQLAPVEELWISGESHRAYYQDIAQGLLPDPMEEVRPLGDGQSAEFRSLLLVPDGELDGLRLGVETYNGEILYFGPQ